MCLCSIHLSYVAYLLPSHRSLIPTIRLPTYLVKSRTQEDERVQRPSSVPVVHTFVPVFLIPKISQDFTDAFYRYVIHEWCSVTYFNGEIMWRSEVIWCEIVWRMLGGCVGGSSGCVGFGISIRSEVWVCMRVCVTVCECICVEVYVSEWCVFVCMYITVASR